MNKTEITAIAAQVKADRKRPLPPLADPLPLRFTNPRLIDGPDGLSPDELRQLVAVGVDGVGLALPPAELFAAGEDEGFCGVEVWDVHDAAGALAYRVWIYGTDNGTVCRGDTVEIVAGMSQGGVDVSRPTPKREGGEHALVEALCAAARKVPRADQLKGSCLRFFGR